MTARVASVFLLVALATAGAAAGPITPPSPAPALEWTDAGGQPVTLASLKGKVVLLDIWASWCAPCKAAFPNYDDLHTRFRDRGFHVLAVNVDEQRKDADRFLAGRRPALQVVFDPQGRAPAALRVKGMPTSFLIDRRGQLRYVHEGFTDASLALYRREILALLEEAP
jgi:thiol-disulfide isomerase/thioredoxin